MSPLSLYIYLSHLYISYFELKFNNIKQKVKNNEFNIELLSLSNNITLDSEVTTTGLSSIFPSGLIIGHVTNIATDDFELANVLKVSPSIDFNNLNYVSVLIRGEE